MTISALATEIVHYVYQIKTTETLNVGDWAWNQTPILSLD